MRTGTKVVWVWAILLVLWITSDVVAEKIITSPDFPDPFVAGELIVAFTEEAIERIAHALERGVEDGQLIVVPYRGCPKFTMNAWDTRPWVTGIASVDSLNRTHGLKSVHSVFFRHDPYGRSDRVFVLIFPEDTDVLRLMNLYAKIKEVEYAHPSGIAEVTATTPNDALFSEQWAHHANHMQSEYGWDIETGDSDIIIALHDTGIDWEHPDLQDNIWVNPGEDLDNDGVVGDTDDLDGDDDDGNGYDDDIIGWDFWDEDWNPQHTAGADTCHGTKIGGIAAAVANNDSGVAGVAWNCKIMPVRVGRGHGLASPQVIAYGIRYARENGADVLNMSWRSYFNYPVISTQIDSAHSAGLVLVASAGNDGNETIRYPAGYDSVIAVAAVDSNKVKKDDSNYGTWVSVSAPGVANRTTKYVNGAANPHQYHLGYCTSVSTAFVSGLAAVLLSYDASLTNSEVRDIIEQSADDIDSQNPSYQGKLGTGRINVFKALFRAKGYGNITADVTWYNDITLTGDVTVKNGVTLTIKPGVTVKFATSDDQSGGSDATKCELIVEGTLDVNGTSSDKVTFTSSASTPQAGDWYGIVLEDGSSVDIDHATIAYAKYGIRSGEILYSNALAVDHSTIRNCYTDGLRLEYWSGTATLENTTIKDSGSKGIYASSGGTLSLDADSLINNGSYHAYLSSCALQANNCVFTDNDGMAEHGIRAYNVSGAVEDTSEFSDNYVHVYVQSNNGGMTLSDTNFDLGAYHIYNSSADTVEAEDNYWGTTNPATISGRMYGPVDWDPYRQGPVGKPILTSGREPVPASFDLMQNFPNPFNPVTVIRYQIPRFSVKDQAKQARVVLEIYNLLGQRVRRFVERTAMPGHYTVTWDSRDEEGRALASGIYFCRMQVGSFVKTNKMLLLR